MQIRTAGAFVEWATFTVEDVQVCALLDTGASRTVGGHTMVQHVIDNLLLQQTPTWMESAEPAVIFTVAGSEHAQSGTKVWLPLPGKDSERFSLSESTWFRAKRPTSCSDST